MTRTRFLFALLLTLGLAACGRSPETPTDLPPEVTITSRALSSEAGYTLTATATDDGNVTALSYTLNGGAPRPITPAASPVSVALTLRLGDTSIVVTAEDDAGQQGSDQLVVTYGPDADPDPDPDPDPEAPGALTVTVRGLPAGEAAGVTVLIPGVYVQDVRETATLEPLPPGEYTVQARNVSTGSGIYVADPPQQRVAVEADATAAAEVGYSWQNPEFGSLAVSIEGLPAGADASVAVSGPSGFQRQLTESRTLLDLLPGDYTIGAAEVGVDDDPYAPDPETQIVTVADGQTTNAAVAYRGPATGSLELAVGGLPPNVAAEVEVVGPNGFGETVTETRLLSDLEPASYTIRADAVRDGGARYLPDRSERVVIVSAGETAGAAVSYVAEEADAGSLRLVVEGLREGIEANVTVVRGDGSQLDRVTGSTVLHNLPADDYTVAVATVRPDSATFDPNVPSLTVEVRAGTTTEATVHYSCTRVNPPDFGLEEAMRTEVGIANGDVPCAALEALRVLGADGLGVIDPELEGLQYAINLEELDLGYNELTVLSEDAFSALTKLRVLELNDNELATLPAGLFSGPTSLTDLYLDGNALSGLPDGMFAGLTSLRDLDLSNNQLAEIPPGAFADLSSLTDLRLSRNDLVSLAGDAFRGAQSLQVLELDTNGLATLPDGIFSDLTDLESLALDSNGLAALPEEAFSGLTHLIALELGDNDFATLPDGLFEGLTSLQTLNLNGNALTALPDGLFAGLTSLQTLTLSSNQLTTLPRFLFADLRNLQTLYLSLNQLDTLSLASFPNGLQTLSLSKNCLRLDRVPVEGILARLGVPTLYTSDNPRTDLACPPIGAVHHDFERGAEGWQVDGQTPQWQGDGHLSVSLGPDDPLEWADDYLTSPAGVYQGDASAYYRRSLRFDVRYSGSGPSPSNCCEVMLESGAGFLSYSLSQLPGSTWSTFDVPLNASAGWLSGSSPATEQELEDALADLIAVHIKWRYDGDPAATGDVDSVVFGGE